MSTLTATSRSMWDASMVSPGQRTRVSKLLAGLLSEQSGAG